MKPSMQLVLNGKSNETSC